MPILSRRLAAVFVAAFVFPLAACLDDGLSLHPLFVSSEKLAPSAIEGRWMEHGSPDSRLDIEASADHYVFRLPGDNCRSEDADACALKLNVVFGRVGNELFLDYSAQHAVAAVPGHVFARVRLATGRFEVADLKGAWLAEKIKAGQIALAHEIVEGKVVITASTEDLQRAVAEWAFDETAFEAPTVYVRPGAAAVPHAPKED